MMRACPRPNPGRECGRGLVVRLGGFCYKPFRGRSAFARPRAGATGRRVAMRVDYLIVGAGLTGGTIARALADAGREVLLLERRPHVGGNVHDHVHASGIRVHTYGPHYFRTSSE